MEHAHKLLFPGVMLVLLHGCTLLDDATNRPAQPGAAHRVSASNVVRARREDGPSYQFEANVSCGHVKKLYSRKGSIDAAGCGTGTDADGKQWTFEGLTKLEDVHTYAGGFDQEDSGSSADGQQPGSSADY